METGTGIYSRVRAYRYGMPGGCHTLEDPYAEAFTGVRRCSAVFSLSFSLAALSAAHMCMCFSQAGTLGCPICSCAAGGREQDVAGGGGMNWAPRRPLADWSKKISPRGPRPSAPVG